MKGKMLEVHDVATKYIMIAVEFEESEFAMLKSLGWDVKNPPKLIVHLHDGGGTSACLSNFDHPPYDLKKQSSKMDVNGTTIAFASVVSDREVMELPEAMDIEMVRHMRNEEGYSGD